MRVHNSFFGPTDDFAQVECGVAAKRDMIQFSRAEQGGKLKLEEISQLVHSGAHLYDG